MILGQQGQNRTLVSENDALEAALNIMHDELNEEIEAKGTLQGILKHELAHCQFAWLTPLQELSQEIKGNSVFASVVYVSTGDAVSLMRSRGVHFPHSIKYVDNAFCYLGVLNDIVANKVSDVLGEEPAHKFTLSSMLRGFDENLARATAKDTQYRSPQEVFSHCVPLELELRDFGDGNRQISYLLEELYGPKARVMSSISGKPSWQRVIENWKEYLAKLYSAFPSPPSTNLFCLLQRSNFTDHKTTLSHLTI
jgi:hypothetical protein